jgi:two-component system NtrC family response regulator
MPHVLVVDDEPGQREMLRLLLEDAAYTVEEASSGEAGLALLRATPERYVVLLDQRMPGLGGDGVLAIVAAEPQLATRHAYILLTASPQKLRATPPAVLHGLSVPLVEKPFEVEALLAVVAAAATRLASS